MLASLLVSCLLGSAGFAALAETTDHSTTIPNNDPRIFYHGRWDKAPSTWWAGSGFKLHAEGLKSLSLMLGPNTTDPLTSVGVSLDYGNFTTLNVSEGVNVVQVHEHGARVVRINVEGWQNNNLNLLGVETNVDAKLLTYKPSRIAFQFIGDSLSAGQYLPQGVDQAWPFLTGEHFKAEHVVTAQPGAALKDIVSYGNQHGVSFQFFRTEDTGYFYTPDHNYTTPWNFKNDHPQPSHVVIHIGANDASQNVTADDFVSTYLTFVHNMRVHYAHQPIFVFTPWGWPNPDDTINYYYEGSYERIVSSLHNEGDQNVFLVNTTGWVSYEDVFPDNIHPNVAGHAKIAGLFEAWLENWGLHPDEEWTTLV
ncbi:unnamed protein product [Peniophora sp. CBMAI 1063]|nr:unnamed protein product [Peniophora sp. CBMAI 1063]